MFRKYLLECDVLVYDLHTADLKEVEEKLAIFKTAKIEEQKIIVVVSSVMVWTDTPKKVEKIEEKVRDEDEENENQDKDKDESVDKKGDEEENKEEKTEEVKEVEPKVLQFEDGDFQTRVPHKDFLKWKAIEDQALALGSKENLSVFIVCAGILYGNGECILEHHFKSAWLESPQQLPYLHPGNNLVPTIHVKDLARITKFIVDTKPESKYIFAVDNTPLNKRKQIDIIQAISAGIGTGEIVSSPSKNEHWEMFLSIDLLVKPSALLVPEEEGSPPFEWHALSGISENIYKLNLEFNEKRGLKPIKIFVSGPPACGKSHFSKILSDEYNIPHIKVRDIVEECIKKHSEFSGPVQEIIKKKEKIPLEILVEIFRWKLHMNHCRNRGYILDGFPRNYTEAQMLFMKLKKSEEPPPDEEAEPKPKEYELDSEILPQNIAVFRASSSFLLSRIEKIQHLHQDFHMDRMARRLRTFKEENEISEKSVFDYFSELNNEVFECECNDDEPETIENLKIYIEREGRPHNFLPNIDEMVEKRRRFIEDRDLERIRQVEVGREKVKQLEIQKWEFRDKKAAERLGMIKEELQVAGRAQGIPLRKYLMDNIMPALAEALIQVCRVMPEDPVDYVAELMYAHSKCVKK